MTKFIELLILFSLVPISIHAGLWYSSSDFEIVYAAIGDWGVTPNGHHDSVTLTNDATSDYYSRAWHAQENVAKYLNQWARENKPDFVLSHGDHFYWSGAQGWDYRWRTLFEDMYNDSSLYVPWYAVMGNHDYGGGSGICGGICWNCGRFCENQEEMINALSARFQNSYTSPNNNRWVMPSHYYKRTHSVGEVTVDIFNIDTNAAGQRLPDTCCQCYASDNIPNSQKEGGNCMNPYRGMAKCVGGDVEMYDACADFFQYWWEDSMTQLRRDLSASTATWKIVHNHYLLAFFTPDQIEEVVTILEEGGAHMFIGGHEHACGHDLMNGVHYLENGGGGGAKAQGGRGNIFNRLTYGFMVGKISKNFFQVKFYDDNDTELHCYNIPNDRSDTYNFSPFYCGNMKEGSYTPDMAAALSSDKEDSVLNSANSANASLHRIELWISLAVLIILIGLSSKCVVNHYRKKAEYDHQAMLLTEERSV